jgi:hypothetical protein
MREMDYFRLPGSAIQYPLTAANKIFGRKLRLVRFRWLTPDEI